jgi:hypothetical protein
MLCLRGGRLLRWCGCNSGWSYPLPHCFAQILRNKYFRFGPRLDFGEKVLFSKNILRKIFERNDLARLGWPGRGGFVC